MSSATATRTISSKSSSLPRWLGWLALTLVIVVTGIAGNEFLQGPRLIPRVTVENPSQFPVEVEVTDTGRDGWMLLGSTQPESTSSIDGVIDQGAEWVFRVHAQGAPAGDFVVSREQLARSGWRVTIPADVIDRIES